MLWMLLLSKRSFLFCVAASECECCVFSWLSFSDCSRQAWGGVPDETRCRSSDKAGIFAKRLFVVCWAGSQGSGLSECCRTWIWCWSLARLKICPLLTCREGVRVCVCMCVCVCMHTLIQVVIHCLLVRTQDPTHRSYKNQKISQLEVTKETDLV